MFQLTEPEATSLPIVDVSRRTTDWAEECCCVRTGALGDPSRIAHALRRLVVAAGIQNLYALRREAMIGICPNHVERFP